MPDPTPPAPRLSREEAEAMIQEYGEAMMYGKGRKESFDEFHARLDVARAALLAALTGESP